jgi:hypothetical protein
MEVFFANDLDEVLVGANPGSFERLGRDLFEFVGEQVHAKRELFYICVLVAKLKDSDLWVWNTTAEPRLWVRLVLLVPVALGWTTTHDDCKRVVVGGEGEEVG